MTDQPIPGVTPPNWGAQLLEWIEDGLDSHAVAKFLAKCEADQGDVSMLIVGDSLTAIYGTPWTELLPVKIGERFPALTVELDQWNGDNSPWPNPGDYGGAPVTLQTGTGANTLRVWNGGAGGTNTRFPLHQLDLMVRAPNPDLVLIAYGANEFATTATHTPDDIRAAYLCLTESIKHAAPEASILCISQHPIAAPGGADSFMVAEVVRELCELRGHGYVNMTQVFADLGADMDDYLQDGTHANQLGQDLWTDTLWDRVFSRRVRAPSAELPSGFEAPAGRELLVNGKFASFAAPPALTGWLASNVTLAKDTVNYEATNGNAYSVKMTSTGAGIAVVLQAVSAPALARLKGRYVTLTARVRVDTPAASDTSSRGTVWLYDGVTFVKGLFDAWTQGKFVYHAVTLKVSTAATQLTAYLVCDDAVAAGTINQWDWASMVEGIVPGWGV